MTRALTRALPALSFVLLAAGCGPRHSHPSHPAGPRTPPPPPMTVAVLPLANDTLKIDTPEILRIRLKRALRSRGFVTQKTGETDELLRGLGVTLGGQVAATHWKEMQKELGVDAVLSGRVLKANTLVTGVVNTRSVEAEIALTSLHDGRILWYTRDEVKVVDDNGVGAAANSGKAAPAVCLVVGILGLAGGAAQADLRRECEMLAGKLVHTSPPPFRPAAGTGTQVANLSQPSPDRARAIAPKGADGVEETSAESGPADKAAPKGLNGFKAVPTPAPTPQPKSSPAPKPSATPTPR